MARSPKYAFPLIAPTKLLGANLVSRPGDDGQGDFGVPQNFYVLLYEWGTGGPTDPAWTHWIKPQIDFLHANGANSFRMMFDATVRYGDSSHHGTPAWLGAITAPQMAAIVDQLCAYAASLGMYAYLSCSESRPINAAGLAVADVEAYIDEIVTTACAHANVVGIDAVQEADGEGTSGTITADNVAAWITQAKASRLAAGRTALDLPVTVSLNGAANATELDPATRTWIGTLITAGVEFLDFHRYYGVDGTYYRNADIDPILANAAGLAVIMAETGIPYNGTYASGSAQEVTHPYSSERRLLTYDYFLSTAYRDNVQLSFNWSAVQGGPTDGNDYGLASDSQDGSFDFDDPRTPILTRWAQAPKTIQPRLLMDTIDLTLANRTGADYADFTGFPGGSMTVPLDASRVNISGNALQLVGAVGLVASPANNGVAWVLYQDRAPPGLKQRVIFDIPPQSPGRWDSGSSAQYATWQAIVRATATSDAYGIQLVSSTAGGSPEFDNFLKVFKVVAGVATDLSPTVQYADALDLAKRWRVTIDVSEEVSPTTITVTLRNVTDAVDMSPALEVTDSTAEIQVAGSMGLCPYLGSTKYDNVQFGAQNDPGPTQVAAAVASGETSSAVDLDWDAADGGVAPITYTPQYAIPDANGFVAGWTDGTPTAGTSGTLTGLSPQTDYVARIKSEDDDGYVNYSPWVEFSTSGGVVPIIMHHLKQQGIS